ncbi:MAG TPA: GH3 auxin-responsive promoter family protein, partial [Blastocatellia bacterium]|nr:GH3 auxin-responsive promoter family protein [Blastocatellia bacterium]
MVITTLANRVWWLASLPSCVAFERALEDPGRAQEQILREFIRRNSGTAFGREHGVATVRSPAQFAERVPVRDYDELKPWIDRIQRGEQNVLTSEPVRRLVPTGGSTAGRKLIPYTDSMHRRINNAVGAWICDLFRRCPGVMTGASYWSISPSCQSSVTAEESAVPIGFDDDAAYLGRTRKRVVDAVCAVPGEIRDIASIEDWRYVTMLLLLRRRDLSLISVWHPSFLELLLKAMEESWDRLVRDVAGGGCDVASRLPRSTTRFVEAHPDPRRSDEMIRAGASAPHELWPRLKVVSCWADGHAALAAAELGRSMPSVRIQPKGLLATEGVVSLPFAGQHPLAIRSHFIEFEDVSGRIYPASEIRCGERYGVILTTAGGLVRYRLNDLVEVDGMVGRTPSIRFLGRSGLVSDRVGEKLSDGFVVDVIRRLFEDRRLQPSFALLAPDSDRDGCRYTLYVNADLPHELCTMLDELLSANPQYAYSRRLTQLGAPRLFRIAGDAYTAYSDRLR